MRTGRVVVDANSGHVREPADLPAFMRSHESSGFSLAFPAKKEGEVTWLSDCWTLSGPAPGSTTAVREDDRYIWMREMIQPLHPSPGLILYN